MSKQRFFLWVLAHPISVLIATVIIFAVCMVGLGGLSSSNDYRAFLDENYPPIVELAEVEEIFQENKMATLMVM